MLKELIKDVVTQRLGPLKNSPKGWSTRDCMLCHHRGHRADTKGRFGLKSGQDGILAVHCFHCFFKAKYVPGQLLSNDFVWFLKTIGVPDQDVRKIKFDAFREKEAGEIFSAPSLLGNITDKWKPMSLPSEAKPITFWKNKNWSEKDFIRASQYADDRKLSDSDIYWTPITDGLLSKRILLPFTYNKKIVGYTGRYVYDANPSIPRYINQMPENFVYNLDHQKDYGRKFTILTEGVLDAYVTDGVSCMGTINNAQIELINNLDKMIIVCPDRDQAGDRLVDIAIEQGWAVAFPNWGKGIKDAAKAAQVYGKMLMLRSIVDSAETSALKIAVNRKMDKF